MLSSNRADTIFQFTFYSTSFLLCLNFQAYKGQRERERSPPPARSVENASACSAFKRNAERTNERSVSRNRAKLLPHCNGLLRSSYKNLSEYGPRDVPRDTRSRALGRVREKDTTSLGPVYVHCMPSLPSLPYSPYSIFLIPC